VHLAFSAALGVSSMTIAHRWVPLPGSGVTSCQSGNSEPAGSRAIAANPTEDPLCAAARPAILGVEPDGNRWKLVPVETGEPRRQSFERRALRQGKGECPVGEERRHLGGRWMCKVVSHGFSYRELRYGATLRRRGVRR